MKNVIAVLMTLFTVIVQGQTKGQVEAGGTKPYLRYTVPPGKLNVVSNSIFSQPAYDKDKTAIDAMPRELASNLGFAGAHVYNEYPGQGAPEVVLSEKAVIIYRQTPQGVQPLYLADCRLKGKQWANRVKLVQSSVTSQTPSRTPAQMAQQSEPVPAPQQQIVMRETPGAINNSNTVGGTAIPGTINLVMSGFPSYPQQPAIPSNTTQTIIHVEKRDWAAKTFDVLHGLGWLGVGTGVAAAGIEGPAAYENAQYAKANAGMDVATINGNALVNAAKARVPDVLNITASSTPTLTGGNNTASPVVTASPTNNATSNPSVIANGGAGGTGGSGGSATGGGIASGAVQVAGSTATSTANGNGGNSTSNSSGGAGGNATATGGSSTSSSNSSSKSSSDSSSSIKNTTDVTNTVDVVSIPPVVTPPNPPPPPPPVCSSMSTKGGGNGCGSDH